MRIKCFRRSLVVGLILLGFAVPMPVSYSAESNEVSSISNSPTILFLFWNMGSHQHRYTTRYLAELDKQGLAANMAALDDITWDLISKYNALVFALVPSWNDKDQSPTDKWKSSVELLRRYLDEGGGILINDWPGAYRYSSLMYFMKPYGFTRLLETIHQREAIPATRLKTLYAKTTDVAPSPVSEGVTQIWYPVYYDPPFVWNPNTDTFAVDDSWKIVVNGGPNSYSRPYAYGVESVDRELRKEGYKTNVPLYAIRQLSSGGRLAFCGIDAPYTFMGGMAPGHEMIVLEKGLMGQSSHMGKLLLNTYRWLCQPSFQSKKLGGAVLAPDRFAEKRIVELPPLPDTAYNFSTPPKGFRGIVGPRTTYSTGKSTVAEYAEVGRQDGWDFIVFLEDYNHLDDAAFAKEQEECNRLSDDKLLLIPGIAYQDEDDAWHYLFSAKVKLPVSWMLIPNTKKLKLSFIPERDKRRGFQIAFLHQSNALWDSFIGFFRTRQSRTPFWVHMDNNSVPVFTSENGELVETLIEEYTELAGNGEWPNPLALNLMDSANQVADVRKKNLGHTVLLAQSLSELKKRIGAAGDLPPQSYATQGPVIEAWQLGGSKDYGYIGNLWDYTRYRFKLRCKVTSDAGLKEVRILDGTNTLFRFLPNGAKTFEKELDLTKQQQYYFTLRACDVQGRQAIGGEYHIRNHNFQMVWCGDRRNTLGVLEFQKAWAMVPLVRSPVFDDGRPFFPFFDGTHHITREGGTGRIELCPTVRFDKIPDVETPFQKPIAYEGSLTSCRRSLIPMGSVDIAMNDFVYDRTYPADVLPLQESAQRRSEPNKVMRAKARVSRPYDSGYFLSPPANQSVVHHVQGEIELIRDVSLWDGGAPIAIAIYNTGKDPGVLAVCRNNETVPLICSSGPKGPYASPRIGPLPVGSYVWTAYPLTHGPSLVLFPLGGTPCGYRYAGGESLHVELFLNVPAGPHRKGEKFPFEFLTLMTPWDTSPSPEFVEKFRDMMGLDGTPGYTVNVETGKVISTTYFLILDGEKTGFCGTLTPPPGVFPAYLPIQVKNLNSRWSAVHYECAANRYRPIGSVNDTAYTHVEFDRTPQRLFIGHPFTCDQPEAVLVLVQTGKNTCLLTIHNPTAKPMKVILKKSPFFTLVKSCPEPVEVPAGECITKVVE